MVEAAPQQKRWLPLESDPEVFSNYQQALGFPTALYKWHDVYGFEPEMWTVFLPQPIVAAVFCYEIKETHRDMLDS